MALALHLSCLWLLFDRLTLGKLMFSQANAQQA
jgi:hypothetical protein